MPRPLRLIILAAALAMGGACGVWASEAEPDTRIGQMAPQDIAVRPGPHCITITNPSAEPLQVEIYGITGQIVESLTMADGTVRVDIAPGYYIVRAGSHSTRVVVK